MFNLKKIPAFAPSFLKGWRDKITEKTEGLKQRSQARMASDEMQSLSSKLRVHASRIRLRTLLPVAAAVVLVAALLFYFQVRVFRSCRILSSVEHSDDSATSYVRLGNRTLKCNPNGVTCVNDSDAVQWNVTFTMQDPILDQCGSMVAVGDQRGQDIYVFDKNGQVGHFEAEHRLLRVCVAEQGVVAAVLEDGEITWVNVYDPQGALIVGIRTSMSDLGYPLSVDISPDGQKLGIAYLTMDNNNIMSKVAFYNFSSVGQEETDHLVSETDYPGTVVSELCFLGNSRAAAFGDNGITFFSGRQAPEKKSEVAVEQEILSVFHDEEYVGIVTASDEEEKTHKYKMTVYRAAGGRCGTRYFDTEYSDITVSGGEIILHGDYNIEICRTDGDLKASVTYDKRIIDVIRTGGFRKYELITADSTDKIRIR